MARSAIEIHTLLIGLAALLPPATSAAAEPPAEPKITIPGAEGDYLRALHQLIHFRFAIKFIDGIATKQPPSDPLNKPGLRAQVYFGIRWDGSVSDALVADKSGVAAFDQAALAAVRGEAGRYSPPPAELFG